ncbi:hypothetical protein Nmel_005367 [Mimus melanotis]
MVLVFFFSPPGGGFFGGPGGGGGTLFAASSPLLPGVRLSRAGGAAPGTEKNGSSAHRSGASAKTLVLCILKTVTSQIP